MSPKPYYQEDGITIYLGDCRELLPSLPKCDLVLTDPPYGINAETAGGRGMDGWRKFDVVGWDRERPSADVIRLSLNAGEAAIVWGGNYFSDLLSPTDHWLIWDKGQSDFSLADVEMAWCSWKGAARRILVPRSVWLRERRQHPTQKPVSVMSWCLRQAPEAETVIDPFLGSGTTLVACKRLGRRGIGIEICEAYCEIAARRVREASMPLFDAPPEQSMPPTDEPEFPTKFLPTSHQLATNSPPSQPDENPLARTLTGQEYQESLFDDLPGPATVAQAVACGRCGRVIPDGQLGCMSCSAESNKAELLASQPERLRRGGSRMWLRIIKGNDRHVLIYGSDRITFCGIELQARSAKEVEYAGREPQTLRLGIIEKLCDAETLATVCLGCRGAIERAMGQVHAPEEMAAR